MKIAHEHQPVAPSGGEIVNYLQVADHEMWRSMAHMLTVVYASVLS